MQYLIMLLLGLRPQYKLAAGSRQPEQGLVIFCVQWTYSAIMEGYARQGQVGACRRLQASMEAAGVPPSAVVFNILLQASLTAAARQGNWALQLQVWS